MKIKNFFLLAFLFLFAAACENKSDDPTPSEGDIPSFETLKEYVNDGYTRLEGSNSTVIEFNTSDKTITLQSGNIVDGWGSHTFKYEFDEYDGNLITISENGSSFLVVDAGIDGPTEFSPKALADLNMINPSNYRGKAYRYFNFRYEIKKP